MARIDLDELESLAKRQGESLACPEGASCVISAGALLALIRVARAALALQRHRNNLSIPNADVWVRDNKEFADALADIESTKERDEKGEDW